MAVLILVALLAAILFPGTARAAISFQTSVTAGPTTGTSLLVSAPSGTVLNDILIAQISGTGANPTITAPSGWTLIDQNQTTTNACEAVYWRRAGAGEGSYTWTFSASGTYAATILRYSGVTMAASPIGDSNTHKSTGSPITWSSVTPASSNNMLVAMVTTRSLGASFTDPTVLGTVLTSRVKQTTSAPSFASWDTVLSGTTATSTFTSGATTYYVTHDILLVPQPAPSVTSVGPTAGPLAGGTSVIITGVGFTAATTVKFGTTAAASYAVNSDTQITAASPAGVAGTVDITITTALGTSATGAADQFTYVAAPTVTGCNPTSGPATGGTSVAIAGTGFTGATAVKFGATAAASYTVNSATSITATSPAGSAGTVDITVTTAGGTSATTASDRFTYLTAVTGISPTAGPTAGGTSLIITGGGFTGATAVKFGTTAAASYTVNSDTQITATSPAGSAGTVDITVTTVGGTSATGPADQFTYVVAPTVTGVSPNAGPLAGGTSVAITGTGFTGATAVKFGATAAASYTVNSATSITAASPAGSAGTVDITVTTVGGTSTTGPADQFTYVAKPTVTARNPTSGPPTGGTSVAITGTGFTGATAVKFGATAAASYTVNSATSITATSPAGTGRVDITVTTAGGTSATGSSDRFSYVPLVTGVSPSAGPTAGGTSVIISGAGFTAATAVKFGSTAAASYTVNSDSQITATSPAGSAGTVHITVTTAGGTNATASPDQFTYVAAPTVTGVSPNAGPLAGGTSVAITGTGFSGASAVKFGATPAAGYTVNSSTQITATSPAGSAGTVDVRVTTIGGTSATGTADYFTYLAAPTITTVSPPSGSVAGGQIVTISGTNFDVLADTSVSFGGTAGTVTAVTGTSISVTTPARDNGATVDVVVATPGGSATATAAYTYVGSLSVTIPSVSDFAGVVLNGTAQTTTATMGTFTVTDSRGTGVGWNVTVQATQFTSGAHTLPLGSVSMPQPSVAKGTPQSTDLPTILPGPYVIDGIVTIKIASAAADGSGEGSYIFTPGLLTLSVPASTYAGTFTSTVTVSVISGP